MPASKLPGVGTTIFTVMSRLAAETGAINLGQGFPDFEPPARLRELVAEHLGRGHNQYAAMAGLPALCEAIAESAARRHGWRIDPALEITVTAGGTEALFAAIHAVARAGEEVIVLDPSYDSYGPAAELAGARVVHIPLSVADFGIDYERLAAAINPRTRMLIVNTPLNPAGAVLGAADWERIADLLDGTDACVLSDESRGARLRRTPPRGRPWECAPARSGVRGLLVRQDLQRDRLEGRLLRGGAAAHGGIP
jgi:methionine aminotransferase